MKQPRIREADDEICLTGLAAREAEVQSHYSDEEVSGAGAEGIEGQTELDVECHYRPEAG
jgi:hypothetical protein